MELYTGVDAYIATCPTHHRTYRGPGQGADRVQTGADRVQTGCRQGAEDVHQTKQRRHMEPPLLLFHANR